MAVVGIRRPSSAELASVASATPSADYAALSAAVLRAFEKGQGDFRVVCLPDTPNAGEVQEVKEFSVMAALMTEWSEVFGAMLSHEMTEKTSGKLEIRGFSVEAVGAFLRFLHSGELSASPGIVVEVAALADKYGVRPLQDLCAIKAEETLCAQNACEILQAASRVGAAAAKCRALEVIHQNAKQALRGAHALTPELLDEVLSSPLLCISDYTLAEVFMEWADKDLSKAQGHNVGNLMQVHVQFAALTEEEYSRVQVFSKRAGVLDAVEKLRRRSKRGTATNNAFNTLWEEHVQQFPGHEAPFLGYWLNVIPSRAAFGLTGGSNQANQLAQLSYYARGELSVALTHNDDVIWFMPHHSVYITGVFLLGSLDQGSRLQVEASTDGASWQQPFGPDGLKGPCEQFVLTECRSKMSAKWVRLTVLEGNYADGRLHVHGILQAA